MKAAYLTLMLAVLVIASSMGMVPTTVEAEVQTRSTDFTHYHNYTALRSELESMEITYPNIAKLYDIGDSWEGRDIMAVKVSDNVATDESSEPEVLYMGAHHGNEKISVEVPLYILTYLVENYGINSTITQWVDSREIWFVPMVNPDGVEANTRKNKRSVNGTVGVDLNRNYAHQWGQLPGTSHNQMDIDYCGPSPFSENETKAIRDLALDRQFVLSMSFHSYGEVVYYPWGNNIDVQHPEYSILEAIAGEITERNAYTPMEGVSAYPTTGDSDDWLYANTSCLPFTVELGTVYAPPENQIVNICEQNLNSGLYLLEMAEDPVVATLPDWTFMVYMAADNSLNTAALADLNEMEVAGSTSDVNIIALFDGDGSGDSKLYKVEKDPIPSNPTITSTVLDCGGAVINQTTNETDMSLAATLENFIGWVMANYPAQKTALIIWNHGDGIFDGLCQDKLNLMQTWELRDALTGESFDIIGLDLCREGHVEVAYELIGHTDYFIASEAEEPLDGWDYEASLQYIVSHANSDGAALSNKIISDYLWDNAAHTYISIAAVDMYFFENEFVPAFNDFVMDISYFLSYNLSAIQTSRNTSSIFDSSHIDAIDLYEFLDNLLTRDVAPQIKDRVNTLFSVLNRMVIASGSGSDFPHVEGLAIYFPVFTYDSRYDANFEFSAESWDEFLKEYLNPSQKPLIAHEPKNVMDNSSGPYPIVAEILDDDLDNNSVFLHYRTSGGAWQIIQMIIDNGNFSAMVPGMQNGTVVEYYISATDLSNNTAVLPYNKTKGDVEYFDFTVYAMADIFIYSLDYYPNGNITEGDIINFTIGFGNDGPEILDKINLSLYLDGTDIKGTMIASLLVDMTDLWNTTVNIQWTAEKGQHTIYAKISPIQVVYDPDLRNNELDFLLSVQAIPDNNNDTIGGNETGNLELWNGVILVLLISSALTTGLLFAARYQVKRKRKGFALKSIRRSADFMRTVNSFGTDTKMADQTLAKARNELRNNNFDKAQRLSMDAREYAELSLSNDLRKNGNGGGII